jgi:hypothetical protein
MSKTPEERLKLLGKLDLKEELLDLVKETTNLKIISESEESIQRKNFDTREDWVKELEIIATTKGAKPLLIQTLLYYRRKYKEDRQKWKDQEDEKLLNAIVNEEEPERTIEYEQRLEKMKTLELKLSENLPKDMKLPMFHGNEGEDVDEWLYLIDTYT